VGAIAAFGICAATVVLAFAVAGLPAQAQESDDVPPPELRRLSQAVRLIKAEYVTTVDDARLAGGCRAGLGGPERAVGAALEPAIDLTSIPPLIKSAHAGRGEIPYSRLVNDCLSGMLGALDGRSEFWPPQEFREMQRGSAGLASIGLELTRGDGTPEIVWTIDGGPAQRAGITAGERLLEIDGWPTAGASLTAVIQRLRGAPQSSVTLVLERNGARRAVTLQRDFVKDQTVRLEVLGGGAAPRVWHLYVRQLREGTLRDLEAAGTKALTDGQAPGGGIILDLRDNTGGLVSTMVNLASAFLREGLPLGQTEGRLPRARQRHVTKMPAPGSFSSEATIPPPLAATLKSAPLLVLVNPGTASGAEMVVAALQAHGRARVVGAPTAGAGTIQTVLPLTEGGALKLTTAMWLGPRGEPIEGRGVTPDVTITTARGPRARARAAAGEDTELTQALEILSRVPR
jgi:carboxyl-terminal processing protease